jgi:AraC family transcriptional regulator, regulatory protein of adaptative response / methylated-DNA-[protein]-cysteine methyltransferase
MVIPYQIFQSPLGPLIVAWEGQDIRYVHFGDSREELISCLSESFSHSELAPSEGQQSLDSAPIGESIELMVRGRSLPKNFQVRLHQHGTPFQLHVWEYLKTIPSGEVRSYREVAHAIGFPRATRAVASACARNNLALFIPCHRVTRSDGSLGGYKWGISRKRALLESEQQARLSPHSYQGINVTGDIEETVPSGGR